MKSYFTVVDGIFTNTNKCQVLLSELNTVVGDGWGRQRDRMMNCTFRFKWGMKIISNTSRPRRWCKYLTSLSLLNDECSSSGPQIRLPKNPPPPPARVDTSKHLQHAMVLSMTRHIENRTHGRRTSGKHLLFWKVKLNFAPGHFFKILSHQFIWSTENSDRFYLFVDPEHLVTLNTHLLLRDKADHQKSGLMSEVSMILFITMETAKSKMSIKCGPGQRISEFFHPAQQENILCCCLSEDFVHWLCLPLSPLEFLHMKKKKKIKMKTKPPRCWRRWAVPGLVSRHNKIFEKALTSIYILKKNRVSLCLSVIPPWCMLGCSWCWCAVKWSWGSLQLKASNKLPLGQNQRGFCFHQCYMIYQQGEWF